MNTLQQVTANVTKLERWQYDERRVRQPTIAEILAQADNLDGEEWRDVIGFEGFYQVSNMGRIRRVAFGHGTRPGYILKPKPAGKGYRAVTMSVGDVNTYRNVHAIVAEAFLTPPDDIDGRLEVNHIDGDKTNNVLTNLEIVSSSQNKLHYRRVLSRGLAHSAKMIEV